RGAQYPGAARPEPRIARAGSWHVASELDVPLASRLPAIESSEDVHGSLPVGGPVEGQLLIREDGRERKLHRGNAWRCVDECSPARRIVGACMGAGPASGRLDADALSWDIDRLAVGIYETAKCAGGPNIGGTQNGQHQLSVVVELQADPVPATNRRHDEVAPLVVVPCLPVHLPP